MRYRQGWLNVVSRRADQDAIGEIRLAVNQNQPIGNDRFHAQIEKMTGAPREAGPRARPCAKNDAAGTTRIFQKDVTIKKASVWPVFTFHPFHDRRFRSRRVHFRRLHWLLQG
jgi:hypothetical protein